MHIVGDIGGTKIDLGIFDPKEVRKDRLSLARAIRDRRTYSAVSCGSLSGLLKNYSQALGVGVTSISLAIAAPVAGRRRIPLTNLPWSVDLDELAAKFPGATIHVANDLEAMAAGVPWLGSEDLVSLQTGEDVIGNKCVIAAGTGLGEALLIWNGHSHQAVACEGGHADFGPSSLEEADLWAFAQRRFGRVSWERIVSGTFGFSTLVEFYLARGQVPPPEFSQELEASPDSVGALVTKWANAEEPFATQVMRMFVTLYGAEAGNLALKCLALGGVYVGGGIAPKILHWLKKPGFFERGFRNKGRFAALMEKIPVRVITSDRSPLVGAGALSLQSSI